MKKIIVVVGVLLTVVLGSASQAAATVTLEQLDINIKLAENGQLEVSQKLRTQLPERLDWKIPRNVDNLEIRKNGDILLRERIDTSPKRQYQRLSSQTLSTLWQISYQKEASLVRHNNRDQVFIPLINRQPVSIRQMNISFELPPSTEPTDLNINAFILATASRPTYILTPTTGKATITDISGQPLLTWQASWNKNVYDLDPLTSLRLMIMNFELIPWLLLGIILPILGLAILIRLYTITRPKDSPSHELLETPPSSHSPLLVSVLMNKKIDATALAALLIDLCQKGYLIIIHKNGEYSLGQRKPLTEGVAEYEQTIIKELFVENSKLSSLAIGSLFSKSLYNRAIRQAFDSIYQEITAQGLFKENPHLTRVRYKLTALGFYFAVIIGLLWVVIANQSELLLFPLAGTLVFAFLIIKLSPRLIGYSDAGVKLRRRWQAYGNFLAKDEPISNTKTANRFFEEALAYSIALKVSDKFVERFELTKINIVQPDWFVSYSATTTFEITEHLTGFTNKLSESIAAARGPLVN